MSNRSDFVCVRNESHPITSPIRALAKRKYRVGGNLRFLSTAGPNGSIVKAFCDFLIGGSRKSSTGNSGSGHKVKNPPVGIRSRRSSKRRTDRVGY